jgi:hypothetical protein
MVRNACSRHESGFPRPTGSRVQLLHRFQTGKLAMRAIKSNSDGHMGFDRSCDSPYFRASLPFNLGSIGTCFPEVAP